MSWLSEGTRRHLKPGMAGFHLVGEPAVGLRELSGIGDNDELARRLRAHDRRSANGGAHTAEREAQCLTSREAHGRSPIELRAAAAKRRARLKKVETEAVGGAARFVTPALRGSGSRAFLRGEHRDEMPARARPPAAAAVRRVRPRLARAKAAGSCMVKRRSLPENHGQAWHKRHATAMLDEFPLADGERVRVRGRRPLRRR